MGERLSNRGSYVCVFFGCGAKFTKSWRLQAHLCKHTGLKPFHCEFCDKSFCARYQLTRHELGHSGEKVHPCLVDGCSEEFASKASMKNHMAHAHQCRDKAHRCEYPGCGKDFSKRNQLKAHMCEHQEQLPFHCTFSGCERSFPTQGKLKHHQKVHGGYLCDSQGCPFLGKTWTEYLKHRKEHRAKVPCPQCDKRFNNSWFLDQHELRVHSGERKKLQCPATGCDREFTHRFSLESHVLADHEGKKPFRCFHDGCGKTFSMRESLWRHGVVHDPAKKKMKKLRPKKNLPWRQAGPGTCQSNINELTAKLCDASLEGDNH